MSKFAGKSEVSLICRLVLVDPVYHHLSLNKQLQKELDMCEAHRAAMWPVVGSEPTITHLPRISI
jgi:hypothetical protein